MLPNGRSLPASKRRIRPRSIGVLGVIGVILTTALTLTPPAGAATPPADAPAPAATTRTPIHHEATAAQLAAVAEAATRQAQALFAAEQLQQEQADAAAADAFLAKLAGERVASVIDTATSALGRPYRYGAGGPSAFDCSGFTRWAWQAGGVDLAHYTGAQWALAQPIPLDELQPGDLVFYWGRGDGDPSHVALYVGFGQIIHAPGTGRSVRYDSIGYWSNARVAAGRIA